MKSYSRLKPTRRALIFWCLFIGIGAVGGAAGMFVALDGSAMGMQTLLPYFQVLPFADVLFQNFLFPGIALLCVNGIPNLIATALMLRHKKAGLVMGGILGCTLMAWICIQFVIFPMNFMSTTYFIFGLIQALTGYAACVFEKQERFVADAANYPHIGTNPKELVVYLSRMGYTKKIACELADKTGAELYEIHPTEKTAGTKGFWWCGRYGMHRWAMPIETPALNWAQYDKVTICSPVWVFHLAAPVRSFCKEAAGKIPHADYVLVHHMGAAFQSVAAEMDTLLQVQHTGFRSICCHTGRCREVGVATR